MIHDFRKFGQHLKKLRQAQNKTLEDVAYESGISISTIRAIENNQRDPSFESIEVLSYCYGVDLFDVLAKYKNSIFDQFKNITTKIDNLLDKYQYREIKYEIDRLKELIESYPRINNPNFSSTIKMYQGIYHLQHTQDYSMSMDFFAKVLDGRCNPSSIKNLTRLNLVHERAILNLASLYSMCGERNKANELLLFLINSNSSRDVRIKAFINMAHNYFRLDEYHEVINLCDHGIKKSKEYRKLDKLAILFWLHGASNIELNNEKMGHTYIKNSLYLSSILCTDDVEENFRQLSKEYYNVYI